MISTRSEGVPPITASRHIFSRRLVAVIGLAVLAALAVAPPAPAAPEGDTSGTRVEDAEQAARDAADRHLDAVERLASTTAAREELEASIASAEIRMSELDALARVHAAESYKRAGTSFSLPFDVADAEELTRGNALLERATADDRRTFEELTRLREELDRRRGELEERRSEQEREAEALEATTDELNARLATAREQAAAALQTRELEQAAREQAAPAESADATTPSTTSRSAPNTVAAPPPPPAYAPSPGTHPQHGHPWMVCTRARESSGDYTVINPAGPFHGAYQFLQSTWNAAAVRFGRSELVGVVPSTASPYDQDDLAWRLYDNGGGAGHWNHRCT